MAKKSLPPSFMANMKKKSGEPDADDKMKSVKSKAKAAKKKRK